MLTADQKEQYNELGFLVIPDVLSPDEVADLVGITEEFIENSRGVTAHNSVYDLEPAHSAEAPLVRRIKTPHLQHPGYAALVRHPKIVEVMRELLGTAVKFDQSKLNLKVAGGGAAVEWHQDWAFYPSTNDDLCAVGVMLDDCAMENGPLMVMPRSHNGPIFNHHDPRGFFCGAIDAVESGLDFSTAVAATGTAGSITVHHVRAVHGSAPNMSRRMRRLLLLQYRAADAWPLLPTPSEDGNYEEFDDTWLVCGHDEPRVPRVTSVPVRLPLPPAEHQGSIYEKQRGLANAYFAGSS